MHGICFTCRDHFHAWNPFNKQQLFSCMESVSHAETVFKYGAGFTRRDCFRTRNLSNMTIPFWRTESVSLAETIFMHGTGLTCSDRFRAQKPFSRTELISHAKPILNTELVFRTSFHTKEQFLTQRTHFHAQNQFFMHKTNFSPWDPQAHLWGSCCNDSLHK